MKLRFFFFISIFLNPGLFCIGQHSAIDSLQLILQKQNEDTNKVLLLLQIAKLYVISDPKLAIPEATTANGLAEKLGYQKGIALSNKYLGNAYYYQDDYINALDNWNRALEMYQKMNDKDGIANMQSNIGAIYKNQGNDAKALEFFFNSLRICEETGDRLRIVTALNNIGSVYQHKSTTYDKALEYYLKALEMNDVLKEKSDIGKLYGNIGEIYLEKGNADSALYYFRKEQASFEGTVDIAYSLYNIGRVYELRKQYDTALVYQQRAYDSASINDAKLNMILALKETAGILVKDGKFPVALQTYLRAEKFANELHSTYDLKDIYSGIALTYSKLMDYNKAFEYQNRLLDIKDSIYNKETDQKLANYEFDFEMEKKQNRIDLLNKNNQLQELDIRRQKFAKNAFLAGFGMIVVLAFILYRNYRNKVKVNRILDSQKAQIEHLLQNILPVEVAHELQVSGTAIPRFYESVSVLFTDFKGFTRIADGLSPQEVVSELNDCFMAFDDIIEKYGLEKIKTIGDSYMCAGGIPTEKEGHVSNMVRAGVEIQQYILSRNERRAEQGLESWTIRIGVHVGPVVAGVVGKKKYAYDIWGSTVNIASRMESNGEPGRVNISEAVYKSINGNFSCTYRGKIFAKNIGEIDMYFVDNEIAS
jgi:class 3 adenylate cyclase